MDNSNLQIVQRLLELGKNQPGFNEARPGFPRHYKEEQIWLSNILSDSLQKEEREFKEDFAYAVAQYKMNLKEKKTYGWFNNVEKLEWGIMQINQLKYAIYGDKFERKIQFKKSLGNKAYKDFINQVDPTALMTPKELEKHKKECEKIGSEILKEILAKEKEKNKV